MQTASDITALKARRLPSPDGLRALSISLVVLGHSLATIPLFTETFPAIALIAGNSELGVSFFFVISGYLITRLLVNELDSSGRVSFYNFYVS